jgi:hypothetical protein
MDQKRDRDHRCCCAALAQSRPSPNSSRRRRSHGRMAHGLVSDVLENGRHRCVPLACFTASEITNHPVSFATAAISPPPAERRRTTRWAYSRHRDGRVITGLCLLCFVSPYPEILIPVSPRYEVEKGAAFDAAAHVRLRGISGMHNELRTSHAGFRTPQACDYRPPLAFQVVRSQDLLCGWL